MKRHFIEFKPGPGEFVLGGLVLYRPLVGPVRVDLQIVDCADREARLIAFTEALQVVCMELAEIRRKSSN